MNVVVIKSDASLQTRNRVLSMMGSEEFSLINLDLAVVSVARGAEILESNQINQHAYFPLDGTMVSLLIVDDDGRVAEVATVGSEGVVGLEVPSGSANEAAPLGSASYRCVTLLPGQMARVTVNKMVDAAARSPSLWRLLADHADTPSIVAARRQTACAALHPVRQRLSRLLLLADDRASLNARPEAIMHRLPISQAMLADLLAVRRTSINTALSELENLGAIRRRHGSIDIVDRAALKAASCSCYQAISQALRLRH
ncbi:Crp/Fnr family transcriptional regulator [Roseicella aquatilis]|uniref:Crp/Fnr family transcriptional regulator n=1 Tax=Roseicella aquatilis TaxID=2527868 RepID=A0A4V2WJC4_9PROT|nr:Crp/Fnr family transcriptional regulator [Roseicella aquatilis]TCZ50672.1 Crp/Fnr family transcriptional regulator [Roseicella aquatilis]